MDIKALDQRRLGVKKKNKILIQIYSLVVASHNIIKRFLRE
jgi:hypothetical protein